MNFSLSHCLMRHSISGIKLGLQFFLLPSVKWVLSALVMMELNSDVCSVFGGDDGAEV